MVIHPSRVCPGIEGVTAQAYVGPKRAQQPLSEHQKRASSASTRARWGWTYRISYPPPCIEYDI